MKNIIFLILLHFSFSYINLPVQLSTDCGTQSNNSLQYTNSQKTLWYDRYSSILGSQYLSFLNYFNSKTIGNFISYDTSKFVIIIIFTIIILGLAIAFIIIESTRKRKIRNIKNFKKSLIFLSVFISILLFLFIALIFGTFSIFSKASVSICQLTRIEYMLLQGSINYIQKGFLGLYSLQKINSLFSVQIQNLLKSNPISNMSAFISSFDGLDNQLLEIVTVLQKYYNYTINSPLGFSVIPTFLINQLDFNNGLVSNEILSVLYCSYGKKYILDGLTYINNQSNATLTNNLIIYTQNTNLIVSNVENTVSSIYTEIAYRVNLLKIGIILILLSTLVIIVITIVLIIINKNIYKMSAYNKKKIASSVLFWTIMIFILIFITTLFIFFISLLPLSSYCNILHNLNIKSDSLFVNFPILLDSYTLETINTCIYNQTDIGALFSKTVNGDKSTDLENIYNLQLGLKVLNDYYQGSAFIENNTILNNFMQLLNNYTSFNNPMFENESLILSTINNYESCSNITFALNQTGCGTSTNCSIITENSTAPNITCDYNNIFFSSYYTALQTYVQNRTTLIENLKTDFYTSSISTNSTVSTIINTLNANSIDMKNIIGYFNSTLNTLNVTFTKNQISNDCTNIQYDMNVLEEYLCYQLNYTGVIMFGGCVFGSLLLLVVLIASWIVLRESKSISGLEKPKSNDHQSGIARRIINLNERENFLNEI